MVGTISATRGISLRTRFVHGDVHREQARALLRECQTAKESHYPERHRACLHVVERDGRTASDQRTSVSAAQRKQVVCRVWRLYPSDRRTEPLAEASLLAAPRKQDVLGMEKGAGCRLGRRRVAEAHGSLSVS